MSVVTLAARKAARADEIRLGFERLHAEMAEYGRARGGRFWVYGSAAKARLHFASDIDILVDFDEPEVSDAADFVETACARLNLEGDV